MTIIIAAADLAGSKAKPKSASEYMTFGRPDEKHSAIKKWTVSSSEYTK